MISLTRRYPNYKPAKLLEDEAKIAQAEGEISSGEEKINQFKQELEKQNTMQKDEHVRQLSGQCRMVLYLINIHIHFIDIKSSVLYYHSTAYLLICITKSLSV